MERDDRSLRIWEGGNEPEKEDGMVRFVVISDTHEQHQCLPSLPEGDVLLHTGDFTMSGSLEAVRKFNKWLGGLNFEHIIVIAGNHELSFESNKMREGDPRELLTNCIYLENSSVTLFDTIRIWGSPWTPKCGDEWAFSYERGREAREIWSKIPEEGIDILMTHGPAYGSQDRSGSGMRTGCTVLRDRIREVKPLIHLCGHIHEDRGIDSYSNEETIHINACSVDSLLRPIYKPWVFDLRHSSM